MSDSRTIALGVEYYGRDYHGWQVQASDQLATVQGYLQKALSFVADEDVNVVCAGRTDSGVHAVGQVVSFRTSVRRPDKAWVQGVNSRLPDSISVKWVATVDDDFHARFSATARRYQYFIYNSSVKSALTGGRLTRVVKPVDEKIMHRAAQALLGENDFSAFRGAGCQSKTAMRNVTAISVARKQDVIIIDIKANAFLLHMVRNIVGSLLDIGFGVQREHWMAALLAGRDRNLAGVTAPSDGLYLVSVDYPSHFGLPQISSEPMLLFGA